MFRIILVATISPCMSFHIVHIFRINTKKDNRVYFFFFLSKSLSGRWFGHLVLLHLSGIVFVPSIISELHIWQILPVGFALMAFLQSG